MIVAVTNDDTEANVADRTVKRNRPEIYVCRTAVDVTVGCANVVIAEAVTNTDLPLLLVICSASCRNNGYVISRVEEGRLGQGSVTVDDAVAF